MKRLLITILIVFIPCIAISGDDVVDQFKNITKDFINSYPTIQNVVKLPGGWVKEYYDINSNYNIDVQSTSSLMNPYLGLLEFKINWYHTAFHKSSSEAGSDNDFVEKETIAHRHEYSYQGKHWVVTKRTHHNYLKLNTVTIDEWVNCRPEWEGRGCSENNIPVNIPKKISSN